MWDQESDNFKFKVDTLIAKGIFGHSCTKRSVLKAISRIYDPHGMLGCFVIRAKIGMQEIWKMKYRWDEKLPDFEIKRWTKFWEEVPLIKEIEFPRWYDQGIQGEIKERELHIFSDASKVAYASVAIIRTVADNVVTNIICSKTRVSPLCDPPLSIPRLE